MSTATCPRCDEQVRVPHGVSPEVTVKCPLCQEEYSLSEPLTKLPPLLIVVDDLGAPPVDEMADGDSRQAAEEAPLEEESTNQFAFASVDSDATPEFDFDSSSAASAGPTTTIRSTARRSKPKGSPVKSILSIVIGGMLAFPIAQLILWYLPGNLKRDFGAGPTIAKYIPQIVPKKFRGTAATEEKSNSGDAVIPDFNSGGGQFGSEMSGGSGFDHGTVESDINDSSNTIQESSNTDNDPFESGDGDPFGSSGTESSSTDDDDPFAMGDTNNKFGAPDVDPEPDETPGISVPSIELNPLATVGTGPAVREPAESNDLDNPTTPESGAVTKASALAVGTIKGAPAYSATDLADAFPKAVTADIDWDTAGNSSDAGRKLVAFYRSMSQVGEVLTFVDTQDEEVAESVAEIRLMLAKLAQKPDKLAGVDRASSQWIGLPTDKRGTNGVCLHGTVSSVQPHGDLFEVTLQSKDKSLKVITREDPSDQLAIDAEVLILGTIVQQPAGNLGGYDGDEAVVILSGLHLAIESE